MARGGNSLMDVQMVFEDKEIGTIPYESIPALFLFLRKSGFLYNWDEENRKIHLQLGLKGKTIELLEETLDQPSSPEKVNQDVVNGVQIFLNSCGATVYREENLEPIIKADLRIVFTTKEDPVIDRPKLEVYHDLKMLNHKCSFLLKEECKKAKIEFTSHVNRAEIEPYMKFLMKIPRKEHSFSQKKLTEKFQIIISMGILSCLQANYPLFLLSYLPFHKLSFLQKPIPQSNMEKNTEERNQLDKNFSAISENTALPQELITTEEYLLDVKKNEIKNYDAEVFFDYQVIFDQSKTEKILLFGNFIIKNTGESFLHNPVICFRTIPKGNINFSGQLVPPNVVETIGVLNSENGWKYMYDDWFQQIEEKGEIWICPIKPLEIPPGKLESFQNFRIKLVKDQAQQNLKIEGHVFFQEQNLKYKANNSISLSF
jgi:hypothetical protein